MSNETKENRQAKESRNENDRNGSEKNEKARIDVPNDEQETGGRGAIVALGAIVLVAIVGWLLFRELSASSRLQDCLLSGRTNCAPIEAPTR